MTDHPSRTTDNLLRKMWQTKSARFNAHQRLDRRHRMSVFATSLLACYLVALSLYQLVFEKNLSPVGMKLLSVTSIVVSVFLIMITLVESSRNYQSEADNMRENALEISKIYNAFQALSIDKANEQRENFSKEYSDILYKAQLNHNDIDRNLFRIPNSRELDIKWPAFLSILLQTLWLILLEYWLYIALSFVPPLLFVYFLPHL